MRLGYIVKRAQLLKIKAQVPSIWAKGVVEDRQSTLTELPLLD